MGFCLLQYNLTCYLNQLRLSNLQFKSTVTLDTWGDDMLLFDAWQVNTAIKS